MKKSTPVEVASSMPVWECLEEATRAKMQGWIQDLLEEEVTAFLGRRKSERREAVDGVAGYRNGYGKPRRLALQSGTIAVRRPRLRGLEERFESRLLPLSGRGAWTTARSCTRGRMAST